MLGRKSFMKISQTKQFPFCVSGHVPLLPPHCVRSFMSRAEKKDSYDTHNEVSACCESQILTGGKTGGRRPYYASRSRIGFPSRELLCFKYLVLFSALVGRRSVVLGVSLFCCVRLYFLLNQLLIQSDGTWRDQFLRNSNSNSCRDCWGYEIWNWKREKTRQTRQQQQ